jgi:hypothetical protein
LAEENRTGAGKMILVECAQGSTEWHSARAGAITASMFSVARKRLKSGPNKGDYSEAAKDYAFKLAIERISGEPLDEGFETWSMRRGHELEEDARIAHECRTGLLVDLAGFVLTDDKKFGASADGLIDHDGGCEYKCFIAPEKLRQIIIGSDLSDVMDQIQGCMWITGREWWHFCLYCPALKSAGKELILKHVKRDDDYINALEQDLIAFEKMVTENEFILRAADEPQTL